MHNNRERLMEKVDADEVKLFEVRRHPIGIFLLYIQAVFGMMLAVALCYFLVPVVVGDTNTAFSIANIFTATAVLITFLILAVATIIYRENRLIVTDRNITQVLQYGLFSRKVSQLNINNIEDVTAVQQGVLSTIFRFGVLKIETAGEQVNFIFNYCPNADYYAKIILEAREKMLGQRNVIGEDDILKHASKKYENRSKKPMSNSAIKELGSETLKQANVE